MPVQTKVCTNYLYDRLLARLRAIFRRELADASSLPALCLVSRSSSLELELLSLTSSLALAMPCKDQGEDTLAEALNTHVSRSKICMDPVNISPQWSDSLHSLPPCLLIPLPWSSQVSGPGIMRNRNLKNFRKKVRILFVPAN